MLILFYNVKGQQETFEQEWKLTQAYISNVDSLCTVLKKQNNKFKSKKSTSKFVSVANDMEHSVTAQYKNGNCIVTHIYKNGSEKKIKVLYLNDKIVLVEMKWHTFASKLYIENSFVRHNNELWYWTFKKKEDGKEVKIFRKSASIK